MTTISRERIEQYVMTRACATLTMRFDKLHGLRWHRWKQSRGVECGENIILFNPDTVEAYAKRAEISPKPLFSAPSAGSAGI